MSQALRPIRRLAGGGATQRQIKSKTSREILRAKEALQDDKAWGFELNTYAVNNPGKVVPSDNLQDSSQHVGATPDPPATHLGISELIGTVVWLCCATRPKSLIF